MSFKEGRLNDLFIIWDVVVDNLEQSQVPLQEINLFQILQIESSVTPNLEIEI